MNASLLAVLCLSSVLLGVTQGVPMTNEEAELNGQSLDYMYGGYPVMDKRRTLGRPRLADYLKMAAVQYELDKEEAEAAEAAQTEELMGPSGDVKTIDDPEAHSVEKRRRRYGFWVTAINKMGNHKRSVMGRYKGHPMMMAA